MMTNSDPEGQFFLPHPHTNNGFFLLLAIEFLLKNKLLLDTLRCNITKGQLNKKISVKL